MLRVPKFVASIYQKVTTTDTGYMTYICFFFVLYWFALFLKFGPLPSEKILDACLVVISLYLYELCNFYRIMYIIMLSKNMFLID